MATSQQPSSILYAHLFTHASKQGTQHFLQFSDSPKLNLAADMHKVADKKEARQVAAFYGALPYNF